MTIAFATYQSRLPDDVANTSDELLRAALALRGVQAEYVAWDAEGVDWRAYDAVILRSTWDYHKRIQAYRAWIDRLESDGVRLFNPYPVVRWNLYKGYLNDLRALGVPTLSTRWIAAGSGQTLAEAMQGPSTVVVKPSISAGSEDTWLVRGTPSADDEARFAALLSERELMVQDYAPEVQAGELSYLFFNGVFSHLVRKVPGAGSIYSQPHLGATAQAEAAQPEHIAQARHMVQVVHQHTGVLPLYARVDTVLRGDTLILMEFEALEPYFFLEYGDALAPQRAADAFLAVL